MYSYHIHTTFCHGENSPEEIVQAAIERGFLSIGLSSHGYTGFDLRYCMQDTEGYIAEVQRLKEKYKHKIEIYLGVEEDATEWVDRSAFDYIIGSAHYLSKDGTHHPFDSNYEYFKKCHELFQYDVVAMAETYYQEFCHYIVTRKPDIIGHFDDITKFDDMESLFLTEEKYLRLAENYAKIAAASGCMFEVSTGAIGRGVSKRLYPNDHLLYLLRKLDVKLVLSSDSHTIDTLDFGFKETRQYLKDFGFTHAYALLNHVWTAYEL
jgi:histidinol-phosphatase (PHP family)